MNRINGIRRIVIVGLGSIGQALIPLLAKHYNAEIIIFDKETDTTRKEIAQAFSASLIHGHITAQNYHDTLSPYLDDQTFLLNLAVSVCSIDLIKLAQSYHSLYLDTCIEPWSYEASTNSCLTSNHLLREDLKSFAGDCTSTVTALVAHGANPGFISILMKKALLEMAKKNGLSTTPTSQADWARLAKELGIKVVQISERDTQVSNKPVEHGHFSCTWSVDGLITECLQPAELGWGTHETKIPDGAKPAGYSIEMAEQGREVKVKTWSPNYLEFEGFLLTHNESLSISEYLTLKEPDSEEYRPTVYYAYHPCDAAVHSMKLLDNGTEKNVLTKQVIKDSIISGIDELGIFLISSKFKSFWLGSNLSIGKAKKMADHNSATSLQVVSSIIAGMKWAEQHPRAGVLESECLDWEYIYDIARVYWEPIVSQETDWTPEHDKGKLVFQDFLIPMN